MAGRIDGPLTRRGLVQGVAAAGGLPAAIAALGALGGLPATPSGRRPGRCRRMGGG